MLEKVEDTETVSGHARTKIKIVPLFSCSLSGERERTDQPRDCSHQLNYDTEKISAVTCGL